MSYIYICSVTETNTDVHVTCESAAGCIMSECLWRLDLFKDSTEVVPTDTLLVQIAPVICNLVFTFRKS